MKRSLDVRTGKHVRLCAVVTSWLLVVGVLCSGSLSYGQDLQVHVGRETHRIEARQHDGQAYFPLNGIAEIMGLQLEERGGLLILKGPRGTLQLVSGRPLIRYDGEYVLLSAPVWRRKSGDWYVTEEFLSKALPRVSERNLQKVSSGRYRFEELAKTQVRVRVANYPDHARIVFESEYRAPVQVAEHEDFIHVQFKEYMVRPEFPTEQPDPRFVSSVEFNAEDVYGSFRIRKGDQYYNFREFTLSDPYRKVVDVYGPPSVTRASEPKEAASRAPEADRPVPEPSSSSRLPPTSVPSEQTIPSRLQDRAFEKVVTIDPGHGGDDYGVTSAQGNMEKTLALELANLIRDEFAGAGYEAMLTRRRDVALGIEQRSSVSNYYDSRVYLSIHIGGAPSPEVRGPIVYVHRPLDSPTVADGSASDPQHSATSGNGIPKLLPWRGAHRDHLALSRELAHRIQNEMNLFWGVHNQVVEVPLAVLESVTAPAILVEAGFLTNPADRERLSSAEFRQQMAATLARTVLRFLNERSEGSDEINGG